MRRDNSRITPAAIDGSLGRGYWRLSNVDVKDRIVHLNQWVCRCSRARLLCIHQMRNQEEK